MWGSFRLVNQREPTSINRSTFKFCSRDCYIRDRFNREEDAEEIVSKIFKRETVTHIPKWFKELFHSIYIKTPAKDAKMYRPQMITHVETVALLELK